MPFVGTDGIMMKVTTMDAIKDYASLDGPGTILDPSSYRSIVGQAAVGHRLDIGSRDSDKEPVTLPKIQIIITTKTAEAGINSKYLEFGKMNGIPSTPYEQTQQMG